MTEQEAIDMLATCYTHDTEANHSNADDILMTFLRELGYERLVDVYDAIPKWFA